MGQAEKFGLPKEIEKSIPPGEKILWTGRPNWVSLGYQAFGLKYFLLYLIITVLYATSQIESSFSWGALGTKFFPFLVSGTLAAVILLTIAYIAARHTFYLISDKRIVIKTGIALVFLLNAPVKKIVSIDRQKLRHGHGNISFSTQSKRRIPYFSCWPSVRPGYFLSPKPAFRSVSDIEDIEKILEEVATLNLELNTGIRAHESTEVPA